MRGGSLVDVELESDFATLSGPGPFKASGWYGLLLGADVGDGV